MTVLEQHMSICEILTHTVEHSMEALEILSTGYWPITFTIPTQLTHKTDQVRAVLQKTNPACTLLFPDCITTMIWN